MKRFSPKYLILSLTCVKICEKITFPPEIHFLHILSLFPEDVINRLKPHQTGETGKAVKKDKNIQCGSSCHQGGGAHGEHNQLSSLQLNMH